MDKSKSEEDASIDAICSSTFPLVTHGIRAASTLPPPGESYEFYQSYPAFAGWSRQTRERLLSLIQQLAACHGREVPANLALDDFDDQILESNDHILEIIGEKLDEATGINKREKPLMSKSDESGETREIVSSWNRGKDKTARVERSVVTVKSQLMFADKPDNSAVPFLPRLVDKPNATAKPLPRQLVEINAKRRETRQSLISIMKTLDTNIDLAIYEHPYKDEILQTAPKSIHVSPANADYVYLPLDETPLTIVKSTLSLDLMISDLKRSDELAIDLEHHSYRSFLGFTCLMQISTREADYIVDTLELRDELTKLNVVTTDPAICKIFHGGQQDINWLQKDFGIYVVNMFDTFFASQKLNLAKHSYDHLLRHYCQVKVDKRHQLSDWRQRPLPLEMVRYARADTHYLIYIYDRLRLDLAKQEAGSVRDVFKRSRQLSLQKYAKPTFGEDDYIDFYKKKNRKKFNSQQLEAFRLLFAWRDQIARTEDECTDYVIPGHTLLQIAEILPRERQGILACFSYEPTLVKQNLQALHKLIKRARDTPIKQNDPQHELSHQADESRPVSETVVAEGLHDWSKVAVSSKMDQETEKKVKVKKTSPFMRAMNGQGHVGEMVERKREVETCFQDPFNQSAIPYQHYLPSKRDIDSVQQETTISKIWKMKKEEPKKVEKRQKPKAKPVKVVVEDVKMEEEDLSIKEMLHGKRKPQQHNVTVPKRAKTANVVTTKKFGEKDFKIFGSHKLKKVEKKGKKGSKDQAKEKKNVNPGGFTEPNFGKVKQKSNTERHGVHSSFTTAK